MMFRFEVLRAKYFSGTKRRVVKLGLWELSGYCFCKISFGDVHKKGGNVNRETITTE